MIEQARIGGRVGSRHAADGFLIDHDQSFDIFTIGVICDLNGMDAATLGTNPQQKKAMKIFFHNNVC
ncbi:MAG: hypothetical protein EOO04_23795 [Chitinophagaceae bacterium]|nr:MAG: hypothetical protein EOO04_23795 [Chitinophagaceae bacterium]